MAETKKPSNKDKKEVPTGFVVLEFTEDWGSYKKGDEETYHKSTAVHLTGEEEGKPKVAKVKKVLKKWVPKEAEK